MEHLTPAVRAVMGQACKTAATFQGVRLVYAIWHLVYHHLLPGVMFLPIITKKTPFRYGLERAILTNVEYFKV